MSTTHKLEFPFDEHLMRLGPVVLLERGVFVKTQRRTDGAVTYVTSTKSVHPLRELISIAALNAGFSRRNAGVVRASLHAVFKLALVRKGRLELPYFVEQLLPAFQERDWSAAAPRDVGPEAGGPFSRDEISGDLDSFVRSFVGTIPIAPFPIPSLMMVGRFHKLRPVRSPGSGFHIRCGEEVLAPTGEEVAVSDLEHRWRDEVITWLTRAVNQISERPALPESAKLLSARAEIERDGYFQRGDLLFLPGNPPCVGHVVRPHFNIVLGQNSERNLAVVLPLLFPLSKLQDVMAAGVYIKDVSGRWVEFRSAYKVCLGESPPAIRPETPGLTVLAYLRWAAGRIAANGAFHINDVQDGA